MYKQLFIPAILLLTIGLFARTTKAQNQDSISIHHPEERYWFRHMLANLDFSRAVWPQSQVVWATAYHTAAPVPIGCVGPRKYTQQLNGIVQNTDIAKVVSQALKNKTNVILVIGDGMGNMHMALPIYMRIARGIDTPTYFERIMKEGATGYVLTHPANGMVTCSAAAATAMATGHKTRLEMVGVDTLGLAHKSVLDLAVEMNMKTALVTDANLTDATPAAFYGHVIHRNNQAELARQLAENYTIDVLLGGGASQFIPQGKHVGDFDAFENCSFTKLASARKDLFNPLKKFEEKDYHMVSTLKQLQACPNSKKLLGLFSANGLPAPIDRDSTKADIPTVEQMSQKALQMVSQHKNGYFAMIECARIDWESHANDVGAVYHAVEEMNRILEHAYQRYKKDPDNTLLIFTSDHETGGLEITYQKVATANSDTYLCHGNQKWQTNTRSLSFAEFRKLAEQKQSLARIINSATSPQQLQLKLEKHTPYRISNYIAQEIFAKAQEIHQVPALKK